MRKIFLILATSICLFSQAVKLKEDKFQGHSWLYAEGGKQLNSQNNNVYNESVEMLFLAFPGAKPHISVSLFLSRNEWMFIKEGQGLIFKIDEQLYPLAGDGSAKSRKVVSGDQISEVAYYEISYDLLQKLASAKNPIDFRLIGSQGMFTGRLSPKATACVQNLAAVIPEGPWTIDDVKPKLK